MAGLKALIARLYLARLNPGQDQDTIKTLVLPVSAATAPAAAYATPVCAAGPDAYGAWVDCVLAATVLVPTLVTGVCISTPLVGTAVYTVDIGSCYILGVNHANAAAVIAAVAAGPPPTDDQAHRAEVDFQAEFFAVPTALSLTGTQRLVYPIFIPPLVGIICRVKSDIGGVGQ
ncbi:unnamed protein product, partial [marine sediment metagenome]